MPDLSIIIVSWNTRDLLGDCLTAIARTEGDLSVEVVVVDNASTDGSPDMLRQRFPSTRLLVNTTNVGFAMANNQGMALARGRYLVLLNSDAFLQDGNLQEAVRFMDDHPEVGICGAKLLNPDGTFQGSYADFPSLISELLLATGLSSRLISPYYPSPRPQPSETPRAVDWIGGAFMFLRREVFEQVGGMDENYWMYSEETDWCYRIKQAGWKICYLPQICITHVGGGSSRQRQSEMVAQLYKSKVRFFSKNYGFKSAFQLRSLLWLIFLLREILSRLMLLILPADRGKRWHYEFQTARLTREACVQALSSSPG